mgnify:CR=1 FL=1
MREMKDSGIDIVGEIPKSWKLERLRYLCDITTGNQDTQDADPYGEYDFYVRSPKIEKSTKYSFDGEGILMAGDGAGAGRIFHHAYGKYAVHQRVYIINNIREIDSSFLFYYISNVFPKLMDKGSAQSTVPSVRLPMLLNFTLALPDKKKQNLISSYLDTQCSEIDATAEDIQKEIDLLEEYKKSVITEAVTKGLNPDAEMKDSKIFYLGQINKTWNLTKVGYCCKKLYRPFEPSDEALVCSNKGKVIPRGDTLIGLMTSDDNAMQGICKGDIAIHGMDTWHGAIACSDYDGKITRVVHVCKAYGDNRFVVYWLQHLAFVGVYKLISNGVRGNTSDFRSWDKVADIYVPNPLKEEQQQIADFLDSKCSEIDILIADKKRQLNILADYKKSLIYEYVTGKKEVPVNE